MSTLNILKPKEKRALKAVASGLQRWSKVACKSGQKPHKNGKKNNEKRVTIATRFAVFDIFKPNNYVFIQS